MLTPIPRPEFVYKYGSAARIAQILRDLAFYFGPAAPQNDLFEFRARSLFTEDEETKFRVFAKFLVVDGAYNTFDEAFAAAKQFDADAVNETYEVLISRLNDELKQAKDHSGVTCFSSRRNDQRMWAAYGGNHTGAVIEFTTDPAHSLFASHLSRVLYVDTKLPICPSLMFNERGEIEQLLLSFLFCVKHVDWRDEKEWRLLLLADQEQEDGDRIVPFERTAITRVFLGPRIDPAEEKLIRDAAEEQTPEIPVFKRRIDPELAYEDRVGFEIIRTFEQFEYWTRLRRPE